MLWGIYSAIYGEVNVSVEKCVEIKGDYVEKQQSCFISVTLKVVRPETFGPYHAHIQDSLWHFIRPAELGDAHGNHMYKLKLYYSFYVCASQIVSTHVTRRLKPLTINYLL